MSKTIQIKHSLEEIANFINGSSNNQTNEIEEIIFGTSFNQPIDSLQSWSSLKSISFGLNSKFNQPIDNLPPSLQSISFGLNSKFNQPIDNLPPSLQSLSFGYNSRFNQPIDNLPPSLQSLSFGHHSKFNQPIDNLPPSLQSLTLADNFNQPIDKLPPSLQSLTFSYDSQFYQAIDKLPILLKKFCIENDTYIDNNVESRRNEIFEVIKLTKVSQNNYLGKIEEIHNLFQILSYRDHCNYSGKFGYQLLEMYHEWNRS